MREKDEENEKIPKPSRVFIAYARIHVRDISESALFFSASKYDEIFCSKFLTHKHINININKLNVLECKSFGHFNASFFEV